MLADAVFEGGGVRGIGLIGAICVAEEQGYTWHRLAGSSTGSIIATLLAAGYKAKELYEIMLGKKLLELLDGSLFDFFPYLRLTMRLLVKKGFYSGENLETWISKLLSAKGIKTFADFKDEKKLSIIVSDITRGQLIVFPDDLADYGISYDKMSVAKVVRMSCSIPFFFEPVKILHKPSNTLCYMVDGGLLSNFPVWLFDSKNPRWPTFGFRTYSNKVVKREIRGPFSLFTSIFCTMMDAHDNRYINKLDIVRTIQVPSFGVGVTDFHITLDQKEELYKHGRKAAELFFEEFTFARYLSIRENQTKILEKV